jgi:4-amino-4-deoxy-L-arabinose transferase-like glycosyltransferase
MLIFVPVVIGAFVFTRWRRRDWSSTRDPLMLAWLVLCGAAVVAVVNGPAMAIAIVPSIVLIGGGVYLVLTNREMGTQPGLLAGWLSIISGVGGSFLGAIRLIVD